VQHAILERRAEPRNHVHLWAVVQRNGSTEREKIIVAELSGVGFKMRSAVRFSAGDRFMLELATGLLAEVQVVRSDDNSPESGCTFLYPLSPTIVQNILSRWSGGSQARVDQAWQSAR
jgi:hypothetical protein